MYPTLIADAYREEQHHLTIPGIKTDPGIRSEDLPGLVCFASRRAILSANSTV